MEITKRNKVLVLKNNIDELNRLVEFLDKLKTDWSIPEATILPLNLVLEEALSNIIFYAFQEGQEDVIRIDFKLEGNCLTMVLTDSGKPFDPTTKKDPDLNLTTEDMPIGGLGIFLIRQIMDEVIYHRDKNENRLTLVKNL